MCVSLITIHTAQDDVRVFAIQCDAVNSIGVRPTVTHRRLQRPEPRFYNASVASRRDDEASFSDRVERPEVSSKEETIRGLALSSDNPCRKIDRRRPLDPSVCAYASVLWPRVTWRDRGMIRRPRIVRTSSPGRRDEETQVAHGPQRDAE